MSAAHRISLSALGILLLGYVIGDKGFAHAGMPPFYVGEVVLGFVVFAFAVRPDFRFLTDGYVVPALLGFDAWCFAQTIPYMEEYGIDSLRDAALYGYSLFAFYIASCAADAQVIGRIVSLYGRVMPWAVMVLPFTVALSMTYSPESSSELPLVLVKPGDAAVHLAGILTFHALGLSGGRGGGNVLSWKGGLFWGAWLAVFFWVASSTRGGLLALAGSFVVPLLLGYGLRYAKNLATVAAALFLFIAAIDLAGVRIMQEVRDISVDQILANLSSVPNNVEHAEDTALWRLRWWEAGIGDTVFGDYFWSGKGFGVNLADIDGFQATEDESLRSPHNATITVLERSGVPGLALWLAAQAGFAAAMIVSARRMRERGETGWQRLSLWILSYWVASFINGTFDVYLEGPQGGIWFWSIFGLGLAVIRVERRIRTGRMSAADLRVFPP